MQNFPVAGVIAPHCRQLNSIGAPHSMQNLAFAGLSKWHFKHLIAVPNL
jgi:hypothetical protein